MLYTKDQAHAEIVNLVANFRANEPSLADVPEAQIEENYIRKLFHFLNWNVGNTGLSVAEWEFVLQRTDEKGKRPDYILQLDGQQLLVMDAKKVKYDMHDPRWITQVYAYAYSTQNQPTPRKIDFAILTDFQEFILLDCTLYAAESKAVSNFRVLDWTCDDFVGRFDTLWELFERENVRTAARTRDTEQPSGLWARYLSPKKVKANRIPPDKTFLAEMDDEESGWRVLLAKDMKKRNPDADGTLITAAVQLLIDRFIFVKALSDREIEEDYLTQLAEQVEQSGLAADDAGWFNACRDIFAKLNQFYNGSIFEPRPELEAVTVSNKVVREVIRDLQPENSPYNFAVLPVEILGTIYERFLGRVVHATDARVKIVDKPEVRKAGGVYYTPQYIVDYIVENTVGNLLTECKTPADVAKLKILDPACGSGSFLLGAYAALIHWHEAWYGDKERLTKRDRGAAYYDSDGRVRLTAKLKRQILLNNLFGVDIDAQAVEVTRFSLSLKALEDTRRNELYEEVNLFRQTVLPDLRHNIKCGNSLIGNDYSLLPMERLAVRAFDWPDEFPVIMAAGGFNAVIGNPPWISLSGKFRNEVYPQRAIQFLISRYSGNTYMPNMYEYFVAQGLTLTRTEGYFSLIVPDRLGFNSQFVQLRKRILAETSLVSLIYKTPFPGITADTLVFVFHKHKAVPKHQVRISEYGKPEIEKLQTELAEKSDHTFDYFEDSQTMLLAAKIETSAVTVPLQSLCESTSGFGGKSALIQETQSNKRQIPTFKGDSIGRYEMRKTYWFDFRKENITGRTTDKTKLGAAPKILLRKTGDRIIATYDDTAVFPEQSLYFLFGKHADIDWKYLLGVLNSSLLTFYYRAKSLTNKKSIAQVKKVDLDKLPIRNIDFSDQTDKSSHDQIVQLVESVLALYQHKAKAKTQADQQQIQRQIDKTEKQIDMLVYELYDLTPDEIAVVEGHK